MPDNTATTGYAALIPYVTNNTVLLGSSLTVTSLNVETTPDKLTIQSGSVLTVNGGTLTDYGAINGSLTLAGPGTGDFWGGSNMSGVLTNSGTVTFHGGSTLGSLVNQTGGIVNLDAMTLSGGTLTNSGSITATNNITVQNPVTLNGAGTFELSGAGLSGAGSFTSNSNFNGYGTIQTSQFTNAGTVNAAGGTLTFQGPLTNSGTITNGTGGSLNISTGSTAFNNAGGSVLTNGSTVSVNQTTVNGGAFTAEKSGTLNLTGDTVNSNVSVLGGGTANISGSSVNGSLTVNSNGAVYLSNSTLSTIDNGGTIHVNGNSLNHFSSASITNNGSLAIDTGSTLLLDQSGTLTDNGTILDNGHLVDNVSTTLTGTGKLTINGSSLEGSGSLVNGSGHTIDGAGFISGLNLENDGIIDADAGSITYNGPSLNNQGTLKADQGAVTINGPLANFSNGTLSGGTYDVSTSIAFPSADVVTNDATIILRNAGEILDSSGGANGLRNLVTNYGTFDLENADFTANSTSDFTNNGTLMVNGTSEFDVGAGHSLINASGAKLSGTGTILGTVNNAGGTVAPGDAPGTLTIEGDYMQSPTGELDIEMAGLTSFDKLFISGNAELDGTLRVLVDPGFDAPIDTVFDILQAGSISGSFADFISPDFDSNLEKFQLVPIANGYDLEVVSATPEPATLPILAGGIVCLGLLRRYKRPMRSEKRRFGA